MKYTCFQCLGAQHRRCIDPSGCSCEICARPKPRVIKAIKPIEVPPPAKEKARGSGEGRRQGPIDPATILPTDGYSESPHAAYMRDLRHRKAQGLPVEKRGTITEETLDQSLARQDAGDSIRAIAADLGVDHSGLARRLKARREELRARIHDTEVIEDPFVAEGG